MIDNNIEEGIYNLGTRLAAQGITVDDYLKYTNSTIQDLKESMRPEAILSVKTSLVMESIAKAENIKATEEEIKEEVEKLAAHYNQDAEVFRKKLEEEGQMSYFSEGLIREKTTQFLVDNANIVEDTNKGASE